MGLAGQWRRGTRGFVEAAGHAAGPAKLGRRLAALGRAMRKRENQLGLAMRKKGRWALARAERKGKQRPGKGNGPRGKEMVQARDSGRRKKFKFFLFLIFPKQVQNEISTQFEIRFQTKQYKILCNSMNAHSLLLTLYWFYF